MKGKEEAEAEEKHPLNCALYILKHAFKSKIRGEMK